jgi:uncharacterized spore protein YtfJ
MTASAGWLTNLAERLGTAATAATIFGDPIERGDTTVVPVARVSYGFGGGGGAKGGDEGSGGGGGVRVSPVGFIEIRAGAVRYRPIRDWATLMPVIALGGIVTFLAARRLI